LSPQNHENINQILSLVELAEDKSPTQRKFLYEKISDFLIQDEAAFSSAEKELMADILCRITSDVEKSIRANFARTIAKKAGIPADLARFLANDDIEIALPILRDSRILDETDLIKVIRTRSTQHQLAIAARENVSEAISQALCDTDHTEVCVCLLNNHSAQISTDTLEILGRKSESIEAYQRPLLYRPFLPTPIAEKMYRWVSISLREFIVDNFEVDPALLNINSLDREQTIRSISTDMDPSEMLVTKLHTAGELSAGFLLKSLRQGEVDLFEAAFATLLELNKQQMQTILYENSPQHLAVACKALELDKVVFATILNLVIIAKIPQFNLSDEDRENLQAFYSLLKTDAARHALKNNNFLAGKITYAETC